MPPTVDWSDDTAFAADGTYQFEIEHAELRTGTTSGHEYISVRLRAVDHDDLVVFDNLSFSPKAKGILKQKLRALGLEGRSPVEPSDLVGRRIKAAVKQETGADGNARMVVDISAKGGHAGYYSDSTRQAGAAPFGVGPEPFAAKKNGLVSEIESDIPF